MLKWERVRPHTKEMNQLSRWLAYFSPKTTPEELKEIAMQDAMINQALKAEAPFLANSKLMSDYEMAEKDRLDRQAHQEFWENLGEKKGKIIGEKIGKKIGDKERQIMVARNLFDMNMPLDQIAQATEMEISELKSLLGRS